MSRAENLHFANQIKRVFLFPFLEVVFKEMITMIIIIMIKNIFFVFLSSHRKAVETPAYAQLVFPH